MDLRYAIILKIKFVQNYATISTFHYGGSGKLSEKLNKETPVFMRILIAPTAYKGSFSPAELADAMHAGVKRYANDYGKEICADILPLADGGDGSVEAINLACSGTLHEVDVTGALAEPRKAKWLELDRSGKKLALVELASACGIAGLNPEELKPMQADTKGLGQVLKQVLASKNIESIVVAVGGSASTDGGSGALYELGVEFYDPGGNLLVPAGGGSLFEIDSLDSSAARRLFSGRQLEIATDVSNPLLGPSGAAQIFGRQKGASESELATLDAALVHFSSLFGPEGSRTCKLPGAGAAGGTAFGFAAALGAKIVPGFDFISDLVGLEEHVIAADLVISGEGRIDQSSIHGKVVGSLSKLCIEHGKTLWLIAGSLAPELIDPLQLGAKLIRSANEHLENSGENRFVGAAEIAASIYESLCLYGSTI